LNLIREQSKEQAMPNNNHDSKLNNIEFLIVRVASIVLLILMLAKLIMREISS
jgi:hypothetical protein